MWSGKSGNIPSLVFVITVGAVLTYLLVSPSTPKTTSSGCPYARRYGNNGDKAFFLGVAITFPNAEDKASFKEMFAPLAKYVEHFELGTMSYELLESDKDPLHIYILERYKDKDYYLNVHRTSEEFLNFRGKFQEMINKGTVVDGHSYLETGMGFI